jgi:hypothetical protein
MRRVLFLALLTILTSDASGLTSLIVPETCAIEASESTPDGGCPAFCVRCTCPCCVSSVEHGASIDISAAPMNAVPVATPSVDHLPSGISPDILHIPKRSLT